MVTHELKTDPKYDNYDFPTISANGQTGHPGHTTPEQDAQVAQLRMMLEQAGYHERLDTLTMVRSDHFLVTVTPVSLLMRQSKANDLLHS